MGLYQRPVKTEGHEPFVAPLFFRTFAPHGEVVARVNFIERFASSALVRGILAEHDNQKPLLGVAREAYCYAVASGVVLLGLRTKNFGSPREPSLQRFRSLWDHHPLAEL